MQLVMLLCYVGKARFSHDRKMVMQHLSKAASLGVWTEESNANGKDECS